MSAWCVESCSCSYSESPGKVFERYRCLMSQRFKPFDLITIGSQTGTMWSSTSFTRSFAVISLALGSAVAQSGTGASGVSFPDPTSVSIQYSSTTYNASAASTTLANDDFSDERLAFLWNQVGPLATGPVTETVEPTPEPSAYGNPSGGFHPYIPSYASNLSTQSLPEGFSWGVASSAFQIEVSSNHKQ